MDVHICSVWYTVCAFPQIPQDFSPRTHLFAEGAISQVAELFQRIVNETQFLG